MADQVATSDLEPVAGSSGGELVGGGGFSEGSTTQSSAPHNSGPTPPTRSSGRARQPSQKVREDQKVIPAAGRATPGPSSSKKRRASTANSTDSTSTSNNTNSPQQPINSPTINRAVLERVQSAGESIPVVVVGQEVSPAGAAAGPPLIGSSKQTRNHQPQPRARWTRAEDIRLIGLIRIKPSLSWGEISGRLGTGPGADGTGRPAQGCMIRW